MSAKIMSTAGAVCALLAAQPALAQVPTVDPAGRPPASSPGGGAAPSPQPVPAADPGAAATDAPVEEGFYYYDDVDSLDPRDDEGLTHQGPVPELHVVRQGDTLWDICALYFNNSWEWPRIWSYNPSITNPHWIYPGDVVRLYPAGERPILEEPVDGEPVARIAPRTAPRSGFSLRQLAFVEADDLETSFAIDAAEEERVMLSSGDIVYLSYPEGKPPQVGRRYAVYSETRALRHPDGGAKVGSYVRVIGEVEVLSVKKGKRARAIVRESMDVIERGARVGPLKRTYKDVQPVKNEKNLQGTVLDIIAERNLIGATEAVIIDLGKSSGIKVGNRLYVVRRGEARPELRSRSEVGKDDDRFPAYAIAEILIVDVGDTTALGMVTLSLQESEVGDRVLMQQSK